jgi:hypothetical protein
MSSSSSLSSARRRRVGAQQVVNPHPTVSSSSQLSEAASRRNNTEAPSGVGSNSQNISSRQPVNPTQLLMQHDYRLFQVEKLIKSINNTANEGVEEKNLTKSSVELKDNFPKVDMNEVKREVQQTILRSNELKNSIEGYTKNTIEQNYDFNSFFTNLESLSKENKNLQELVVSNQKYINDLNSNLLLLMTDFRRLQNDIKNVSNDCVNQSYEEVIEKVDKINNLVGLGDTQLVDIDLGEIEEETSKEIEEETSKEIEDEEGFNEENTELSNVEGAVEEESIELEEVDFVDIKKKSNKKRKK